MITSKEIEISYIWDEDNFRKMFDRSYEYEYKNSPRRYIGWLFIALAQFGVVLAFKRGVYGLLFLSTILLFYWYFLKKFLLKRRAFKEFRASKLKDKEIRVIADDDGLCQDDRIVPWDRIKGAILLDKDILLYIEDRLYYIPASAYKSIEDRSYFIKLLKSKDKIYV